jgi:methylated-DNA-[protein]-cysteine S-methyltransferase
MRNALRLWMDRMETPIGVMLIVTDGDGAVRAIDWADYEVRMRVLLRRHYGDGGFVLEGGRAPDAVLDALGRYFAGEVGAIDAMPVATAGTSFQREVWAALRGIAAGETITYATLAQRIGRPVAVRAVGAANGQNPVGVVVPCHRVIGADGSLTGYGGGMERKAWLLKHEGAELGIRHFARSDGLVF